MPAGRYPPLSGTCCGRGRLWKTLRAPKEVVGGLGLTTHSEAFCACRPVSDPFGYLLGAGPPVETPKSKKAWGELVKGLRVRGPASKSDPSLAAGLMRLCGAGGGRPHQQHAYAFLLPGLLNGLLICGQPSG